MAYDPERHHRKSIRLQGWDYANAGAYFITIVTYGRVCIFGHVSEAQTYANRFGTIVNDCWLQIPEHFSNAIIDAFVIMPNHIHGIVMLYPSVGATHASPSLAPSPSPPMHAPRPPLPRGPAAGSIGGIIGAFKSASTRSIRSLYGDHVSGGGACVAPTGPVADLPSLPGGRVWQRNYYEHIIRSDAALDRIREYILRNPEHWPDDPENPARAAAHDVDRHHGRPASSAWG